DEEVEDLVGRFCGSEAPDDWNLEGLAAALKAMGIEGPGASEHDLWEVGGREALTEHVRGLVDAALEAKEAEVGAADWAVVERLVLLRSIDSLWVEHLTELDDMRRGIGLRGYSQQDPLNEFRKEAFGLYEELSGFIRHGVATTIFRVSIQPQPQPASGVFAMPGPGQAAAGAARNGTNGRGARATARAGAA